MKDKVETYYLVEGSAPVLHDATQFIVKDFHKIEELLKGKFPCKQVTITRVESMESGFKERLNRQKELERDRGMLSDHRSLSNTLKDMVYDPDMYERQPHYNKPESE